MEKIELQYYESKYTSFLFSLYRLNVTAVTTFVTRIRNRTVPSVDSQHFSLV